MTVPYEAIYRYSSRSLDAPLKCIPQCGFELADTSTKNIIDCGFFRHLKVVAGSVHRCLAATSIGVVSTIVFGYEVGRLELFVQSIDQTCDTSPAKPPSNFCIPVLAHDRQAGGNVA
jgi:hypothetical protein